MILATRSGNRELRFGESLARIPSWGSLGASAAGQNVTTESALTLAVLGRAVRLVSGIAASLPIRVFQGRKGDRQERPDTPQGILLNQPHYGVSAYDWRYDIFSSLEAVENAFLMKRKDNAGRVVELEVIPHYAVVGRIDKRTGQKLFDVQTVDGKKTYTTSDVLHVRGQTVGGGPFGVSRITQHRDPIGSMLAAQRFEGTYLRKHARPDIAVVFPQGVTRDQAKEWKPDWEAQYGGPEGAGGVFPMGGGADIKPIPLSLRDAQFIEARNLSIEDGGRIMDLDPLLLGAVSAGSRPDRAAALEHFLHVDLPPRLRRVEAALAADPDIFPAGAGLYPQSEVDELMFAEPLKRAQVQHFRIQDGTELVDEARADNGRGPLPPIPTDPTQEPGKVPQITPVGGAPTLPVPPTGG
jgi:HK97 family phage portal protein